MLPYYSSIAVFPTESNMGADFSRFLMKGIHAVVMVVETEPPSGHVAGEAGGVIGAETALFRQRFRGIAAGVLQQQIPEPPERVDRKSVV